MAYISLGLMAPSLCAVCAGKAFVSEVVGNAPLASWQPHYSMTTEPFTHMFISGL